MSIRKNRITILDIARASGLSKSAVAYALSGNCKGKVSVENKHKALMKAEELGYLPNIMAKSLRSNKSLCIGIMLPSPTNYFYGALTQELQKVVWAKGYTAFFTFWERRADAEVIRKSYQKLLAWNVDGIITCELEGVFPKEGTTPFVFYQPSRKLNHDVVSVDYSVLIDGMRYLMEKGHRDFALIASSAGNERNDAFFEGLKQLELKNNPDWIFLGRNPRELGREAMKRFLTLKRRPTVVICGNDLMAISAMNEANAQGVKVPEQIAFVGVDDVEESAFANPPLTTFNVPVKKLAEELTELIFARIKKPEREKIHKTIKPELIIRAST